MTCWRLVLVLGFGLLFTAVTRHQEVAHALRWFLDLVHIPSGRLAFRAALTIRFFPLLVDAADEIREAGRARAVDAGRRPFRRARALVVPLVRNALLRSEDLSLALASRGFEELPRRRLPRAPAMHVAALALFAATVIASLYL